MKLAKTVTLVCSVSLAIFGGIAFAQHDKYTVKVPGGLEFSAFRGYESWQVVSTSQNDRLVAVILANPVMIEAYRAGIPGNGKLFPDGAFAPGTLANQPPQGNDAKCGFACHTIVEGRDCVFTEYGTR